MISILIKINNSDINGDVLNKIQEIIDNSETNVKLSKLTWNTTIEFEKSSFFGYEQELHNTIKDIQSLFDYKALCINMEIAKDHTKEDLHIAFYALSAFDDYALSNLIIHTTKHIAIRGADNDYTYYLAKHTGRLYIHCDYMLYLCISGMGVRNISACCPTSRKKINKTEFEYLDKSIGIVSNDIMLKLVSENINISCIASIGRYMKKTYGTLDRMNIVIPRPTSSKYYTKTVFKFLIDNNIPIRIHNAFYDTTVKSVINEYFSDTYNISVEIGSDSRWSMKTMIGFLNEKFNTTVSEMNHVNLLEEMLNHECSYGIENKIINTIRYSKKAICKKQRKGL